MKSNIEISVGIAVKKCSSKPSNKSYTGKNGVTKNSKTMLTELCLKENLEREGKDTDINTELSKNNVYYTNYTTSESWLEEIEKIKQNINDERRMNGAKKLQSNAVDNVSIITKPAYEAINSLSLDLQKEFSKDSFEAMQEVIKELCPSAVIGACVCHNDELAPHNHYNILFQRI